MADKSPGRAEDQPWWDEFVSLYKLIPLRELARRFQTNSRRLRRAAQRSGLEEEPVGLKEAEAKLGTLPDASLAEDLHLTPEMVKGARFRRNVPPFDPRRPRAKLAQPVRKPAPPKPIKMPRVRPDPDAVQVVVRRAPPVERRGDLPQGVSLSRALPTAPAPTPPPVLVPAPPPAEPEVAARGEGRRRVIRRPEASEPGARPAASTVLRRGASSRSEHDDPEPEPEAAPPQPPPADPPERPRRRIVSLDRQETARPRAPEPEPPPPEPPALRRKPRPPEVRVFTPTVPVVEALPKSVPRPPPRVVEPRLERLRAAIAALPPSVEPSAPARSVAPRAAAPAREATPVAPAVVAPVVAPAVVGPASLGGRQLEAGLAAPEVAVAVWQAVLDDGEGGQTLILMARTLLEAARLASARGRVVSLGPAALL